MTNKYPQLITLDVGTAFTVPIGTGCATSAAVSDTIESLGEFAATLTPANVKSK